MFKPERLNRIKELMIEKKQMDVSTLSGLLDVSEATIRSDLEQLEQNGFLTRFHGGAALNDEEQSTPVSTVITAPLTIPYDKDKEEIGLIASKMIHEREWIFLGAGTTSAYIAKALSSRHNLNILTNNLLVANILGPNPGIQVLFLGGKIYSEDMFTIPEKLEAELEDYFLSKAFFSVDAVSMDAGYTLTDVNVIHQIKTVSTRTSELILGLDHKKFNQRSFMCLGDLDFAPTIISNDKIPPEYLDYYQTHQIQVYTSYTM